MWRLLCLIVVLVHGVAGVSLAGKPNVVVFYTDDHGHADLSCQGVVDDVKTPHIDGLAKEGVVATAGYSTAPQCVPSRGGLMVGKFQSKFGLESNASSLDGFNQETTIATRLQNVGYVTAHFGKWHLGPGAEIPTHGFRYTLAQNSQAPFDANITLDGDDKPMGKTKAEMYHIDACSRAAAGIIDRFHDQPLFLYVAYRAPHVPLDPPAMYVDRFPGEMPERRRKALAMISAVDDGVGNVVEALERHELMEKTLIFLIGDNGAPYKITKEDEPGGGPGWDGSLNDPLNGEKGMLTEGGMHTPFVISWKGTIPPGQRYGHAVSALDVAATAASLAGIEVKPGDLDGVNLIPYLKGEKTEAPHETLTWRWISQGAIRQGSWKLLVGGDREYLFDLENDLEEKHNLLAEHPEKGAQMRQELEAWSQTLVDPGLKRGRMAETWDAYYDNYLDGLERDNPKENRPRKRGEMSDAAPQEQVESGGEWSVRNGEPKQMDGGVESFVSDGGSGSLTLIRNGVSLKSPVTLSMDVKSEGQGSGVVAWREKKDRQFEEGKSIQFKVDAGESWKRCEVSLPTEETVIHVRLVLSNGISEVKNLKISQQD